MMESDSTKGQVYTPHLKKVLRSFQAAANTSLHGPNSVMGMWRASLEEKNTSQGVETSTVTAVKTLPKLGEEDPFTAPPPFPIQQPPIFTPPDQSGCEKTDTILEDETISCFTVGGERRLCLPQILNTVLRDFSLQQINGVCDKLHIFCSRCTAEQLEVLKNTAVLPLSAPSCGLITKSDAERLCSALLDNNPPKVMRNPDVKPPVQVRVHHECFGKCTGLYTPDLYMEPMSRCIECIECHGLFSPQRFVCHAHHPKENRTCHWGFDSFNWRFYLILDSEIENDLQMKEVLKEMKSRYDYSPDYKYKRKQIHADPRDPNKKVRLDNFYPYPYALDPPVVYWYTNSAWNKMATAFKPLAPAFGSADEKPLLIAPEALPHFLRDRSPYFLHDSIQASEHALPIPENERYEAHYHTTVAYGSMAMQKLGLKKDYDQDQPNSFKETDKFQPKKEPTSSCCFDSEETFSDASTLSGVDENLVFTCEEEGAPASPLASNLQPLLLLLDSSGVDSPTCSKIVAEVENIIAKYRKCLKASIQSKKQMQTEFEKVHSKQRDRIRKLKETSKFLEKEIFRLQSEDHRGTLVATTEEDIVQEEEDEQEAQQEDQQQPEEDEELSRRTPMSSSATPQLSGRDESMLDASIKSPVLPNQNDHHTK